MSHKVDTVKSPYLPENGKRRDVEIHWHQDGSIEIRLPDKEEMVIAAAFLPLGGGRRYRGTIVVRSA